MNRFARSDYDKKISGICGGLGERYNIDSNVIRVIFLLLYPYFNILLFIYIVCIFIIPIKD